MHRVGTSVCVYRRMNLRLDKRLFLVIIFISSFYFSYAFAESTNVGSIHWQKDIVSSNSFVDIIVKDDDMNKKEYPNFADEFTITVWSDSKPNPMTVKVAETGIYTGIFKGSVYVTDNNKLSDTSLFAKPGDILYAKYVDTTVPAGSYLDIVSEAVVKISGQDMSKVLEKIDPLLRKEQTKQIPEWVKNNAKWWVENEIDTESFVQGIQFLIKEKLIKVSNVKQGQKQDSVPDWIKNNARGWSDGTITDSEFLKGIEHLVSIRVISVNDSTMQTTDSSFSECQSIASSYKRLNCERDTKHKMELLEFKTKATPTKVGQSIFYVARMGDLGNTFEIMGSGQAMLRLRIMVENAGSENITLMCTGPAICNYDIWDGKKAFKYASMDFVSGKLVIKPQNAYLFNMVFGPNIGYGGTTFEYDSSKEYFFRVNESWGTAMIPLKLSPN